jgi:hypothetical protein
MAVRLAAPELSASHWAGSTLNMDSIGDISAIGVYLRTEKRWPLGTLVTLTLQMDRHSEEVQENSVVLRAKVMRWGDNGLGLAFVLPKGMDIQICDGPSNGLLHPPAPESILRDFRLAAATAFLLRACPRAGNEVAKLLHEGLESPRDASAVQIVLQAERLLASWPNGHKLIAPPTLLVRILQEGSWAEDDWTRLLWAKLLAASCTPQGQDESNAVFVEVLNKLSQTQVRILAAACTKQTKFTSGPAVFSSRPFICMAEDLIAITSVKDLQSIDKDLVHLCELQLIERSVRSSTLKPGEKVELTATRLGLELYERCSGQRR